MELIEGISRFFGEVLTPGALLFSALAMLPLLFRNKVLFPRCFISGLKDGGANPLRALCLALAGTLGVGNITGVTSAIMYGGPGAVFWMWVGAVLVTGVKYAEVYLAVSHRRRDGHGYHGGAMYYIGDGIGGRKTAASRFAGSFFAFLCIANSLVTGNIVQANAASCSVSGERSASAMLKVGTLLAFLVLLSIIYGVRRLDVLSSYLIPPLSAVYIVITVYIIAANHSLLPDITRDIFSSAFSFRSVGGGAVGFGVREAVRCGVMRGIFSNEAGCGTSPTAHASAETESAHAEGCLGIVEVIFDTLILCTLSAYVMLIADRKYGAIPWMSSSSDGAGVTLDALGMLGGGTVRTVICVSIVLFAYASIIAQLYYGSEALRYLTDSKLAQRLYYAVSVCCVAVGSVIDAGLMWAVCDILLGLMTVLNCAAVFIRRHECYL